MSITAWLVLMSVQLYYVVSIQENCEASDGRGLVWRANPAQWSTTNCSSVDTNLGNVKNFYQVGSFLQIVSFDAVGEARWYCHQGNNVNYFNSSEPDRTGCEVAFKIA